MTALLLNEKPLFVLPSLAVAIGLNEAIVLQQINYWIKTAEDNPKLGRRHEDRVWIYNDYDAWQEKNFPFWSVSTIKRAVYSLEKQNLLITEIEENPGYAGGKRKWYAINYDNAALKGSGQIEHRVGSKWTEGVLNLTRGSVQNDTFYNKESDRSTETTTEITPDKDSGDTPQPTPPNPQPDESPQGTPDGVQSGEPLDDPVQVDARGKKQYVKPTLKAMTLKRWTAGIIANLFNWNWQTMTESEKGQIRKAAKELVDAAVSPLDVPSLYAYCDTNFSHFKPMALPANRQNWLKDQTHEPRNSRPRPSENDARRPTRVVRRAGTGTDSHQPRTASARRAEALRALHTPVHAAGDTTADSLDPTGTDGL